MASQAVEISHHVWYLLWLDTDRLLKVLQLHFAYTLGHTNLILCCSGRNGLQTRSVGRFNKNDSHVTSISCRSSPNSRNLPSYTGQASLQLDFGPSIRHCTQPGRAFWKVTLSRVLAQVTAVYDKTVDIKLSLSFLGAKIRVGRARAT